MVQIQIAESEKTQWGYRSFCSGENRVEFRGWGNQGFIFTLHPILGDSWNYDVQFIASRKGGWTEFVLPAGGRLICTVEEGEVTVVYEPATA